MTWENNLKKQNMHPRELSQLMYKAHEQLGQLKGYLEKHNTSDKVNNRVQRKMIEFYKMLLKAEELLDLEAQADDFDDEADSWDTARDEAFGGGFR